MRHYTNPAKEYRWEPCDGSYVREEENKTVFIRGNKGLRRDTEGRPMMEFVFKTWSGGQHHVASKVVTRNTTNEPTTLLLNQLLSRNSTIKEPNEWQKEVVISQPEFTPSFRTTLLCDGTHAVEGVPVQELPLMKTENEFLPSPRVADHMRMILSEGGMPMRSLGTYLSGIIHEK